MKKLIRLLIGILISSLCIWIGLSIGKIEITNVFFSYLLKCGISIWTIGILIILWFKINIKKENEKKGASKNHGLSSFLLGLLALVWFIIALVSTGFVTKYTDV